MFEPLKLGANGCVALLLSSVMIFPLTLAIVFPVMQFVSIDLQRISLGALIIALTLLVDDAMSTIDVMTARLARGEQRERGVRTVVHGMLFDPEQGGNLAVETNGFTDASWVDGSGHPRSEQMRIRELYHRRDAGHMDLEVTFEDPKYYTRPFTIKTELDLITDSDILEFVCGENEKDRAHMGKR